MVIILGLLNNISYGVRGEGNFVLRGVDHGVVAVSK